MATDRFGIWNRRRAVGHPGDGKDFRRAIRRGLHRFGAREFVAPPLSAWLLGNRRSLGLSFGASHTIHYFAVLAFLWLDPEAFRLNGGEIRFQKLAPVVVLALLIATSFDRMAAMLGRRTWKALHLFGVYFYWLLFLAAFGKRAAGSAFYTGFTVLILAMMMVRVAAAGKRHWLSERTAI